VAVNQGSPRWTVSVTEVDLNGTVVDTVGAGRGRGDTHY
jgi:hypothetical protein